MDIYVAAVHRSLLRPNHRTICNEKLAILRFAKRIRPNNIPQTGILTNPSISNRAQTRASSSRREECEEREREERRTTHFSFPLRRYSSPQHLNTVAAPTLPFLSVPCRSGSLFTHTYTHTYTYIHVAKNRGGEEIVTERGEREREKDTERYGTEMSHAESHRRLSLSPRLLFFVRPLLREHADWTRRYGRLGGAWSRVPRELTRAAAREPLRSTVRSPARLAATHLPTFLAPDRRSPFPLSSPPPSLSFSPSHPLAHACTWGQRRGRERERWRSGDSPGNLRQRRVVVIAFPDNCRRVIVDAVSYFPTTAGRPMLV